MSVKSLLHTDKIDSPIHILQHIKASVKRFFTKKIKNIKFYNLMFYIEQIYAIIIVNVNDQCELSEQFREIHKVMTLPPCVAERRFLWD